jgi:hypothetical protein
LFNPILGILASSGAVAGGSYESIATLTVASGTTQAALEFTSIPSTYKHLQLRFFGNATSNTSGTIQINGNTTTGDYWTHTLGGNGSSAYATAYNNIYAPYYTGTGGKSVAYILDLLDYATTTKLKTFRLFGGYDANSSGSIFLQSVNFNSTSAVSSIKLLIDGSTNWNAGTHAALYGIKD